MYIPTEMLTLYKPGVRQTYTQTVKLTNHLRATVEANIRAGSPERYTLLPASLTLRPGQSATVDVVLRVLKFAARKKATQSGQRDIFHIRVRLSSQGICLG